MNTESRAHDRHEWVNTHGRRMATISCPFCGTRTDAHLWSLAGSGKRCPGCRALHTFHPAASTRDAPPAGNGD